MRLRSYYIEIEDKAIRTAYPMNTLKMFSKHIILQ